VSNATSISDLVDRLPQDGPTVRLLQALDFVTPGQWQNLSGFDNTIKTISRETDPALLGQVRQRALKLYGDPAQGYQRAMSLFQTVDRTDAALGAAAVANTVGQKIGFLSFLSKITPKSEKAQAIDLAMKLITELLAFCQINGIPGDSVGDFVRALAAYERESLVRMSAIICVDGLLPLGPDFARAAQDTLGRLSPGELEQNATFQRIKGFIPGDTVAGQLGFIGSSFGAVQGWIGSFVGERALTREKVVGGLKTFIDGAEQKLDYLAGFLDMTTNYVEHTGSQSLARSLVNRALAEI
jgi:hypothetical protein